MIRVTCRSTTPTITAVISGRAACASAVPSSGAMITQSTSAEHSSARRPRLVVVDDRIVPRLFRYVILAAPRPP
jgi:hypothetical protein